ncbi:Cro/CI family transcriptional regulator, partial [Klebsiella pneumoniae]|nr:Cro/CI family transcriptional regulator [Klebsiella pneumoniae]
MTTDDVEKYFGNAEKVAEFFGISSEAVYQWRNRPGRLIPKGRAAEAAYR